MGSENYLIPKMFKNIYINSAPEIRKLRHGMRRVRLCIIINKIREGSSPIAWFSKIDIRKNT